MNKHLFKTIKKLTLLLLFTLLLSATANALSPVGITWLSVPYQTVEESAQEHGLFLIDVDELQKQMERGSLFLLDSRPTAAFEAGHIPGAFSLPWTEIELEYPSIELLLPRSGQEGWIVVYCSGLSCDTSVELGRFLKGQGFENVQVYAGGISEWRRMNLPIETGAW